MIRILQGDCRDVLKTLPDESVHCVVTSPPYWGLRDYGTAVWSGGDVDCQHDAYQRKRNAGAQAGVAQEGSLRDGIPPKTCKCGATRIDNQIGLEDSPAAFVDAMVSVFAEIRRVLRADGTVWLNLGDSYAAGGGKQVVQTKNASHGLAGMRQQTHGFAPKQLIGIPWRVAFALQASGWYLRQDVIEEVEIYCPCGCGYVLEEHIWRWSQDRDLIWRKPNPMPESVRDRCTKSHEYIFHFSKSERYYFDAKAIAEPVAESTVERLSQDTLTQQEGSDRVPGKTNGRMKAVPPRFGGSKYGDNESPEHRTKSGNDYEIKDGLRNKRSVWTVATQPFKEAHFATFPPALIEPCILAGCPEGGTVLDPFGGAGTTGLVADRNHRNAILIELSQEYIEIARERITGDAPLFAEVQ